MSLNWQQYDYFGQLLDKSPESSHTALEMLVDDIHIDEPTTVSAFLGHCGSEDFIWRLIRMLTTDNTRVAGNAAYVFGTLGECSDGQARVLSLINGPYPQSVLPDLTDMLDSGDEESVMNAAGTIATLAESAGGREWMLKESCLKLTISRVASLLTSRNAWTASNAALILARLSIAEEGCHQLLDHSSSREILTRLIDSMGIIEAGCGLNAAFALGRLCDTEAGSTRLLQHPDSKRMMSSVINMLMSKDFGSGANACYVISCIASSSQGYEQLFKHSRSDMMLQSLSAQLGDDEVEKAWFAAMTLRTLASRKVGCLRMRDHPQVVPSLEAVQSCTSDYTDLREEVDMTLKLLRNLPQPPAPTLYVRGHSQIEAEWNEVTLKNGLKVTYRLFHESKVVYEGKSCSHIVSDLEPDTQHTFSIQLSTEDSDSPVSLPSTATTEPSLPGTPTNLRVLATTTSQIKLGWEPPKHSTALRGYAVFNGNRQIDTAAQLSCIICGLASGTTYDLHVCAYNHKGKGPKVTIKTTTTELGKHAPSKPTLTVRGRSEIHVTWAPPEFPLGRLHRFELTQNGKVVYSGTELNYTAQRLTPSREYRFTAIAITSKGKCESDVAKKRTPKDEYNVQSTAPLFFSHPVRSTDHGLSGKAKDKTPTRSETRHSSKRQSPAMQHRPIDSVSPISTRLQRPLSALSNDSSNSRRKSRQNRSLESTAKQNRSLESTAKQTYCSSNTMASLDKWQSKHPNNLRPSSQFYDEEENEDVQYSKMKQAHLKLSPTMTATSIGVLTRTPISAAGSLEGCPTARDSTTSWNNTPRKPAGGSCQDSATRGHSADTTAQKSGKEPSCHQSPSKESAGPVEVMSVLGGCSKRNVHSKKSKHSIYKCSQKSPSLCKRPSGQEPAMSSAFKLDKLLRSLKSSAVAHCTMLQNSDRTSRPEKESPAPLPVSLMWDPRLNSEIGSPHLFTHNLQLDRSAAAAAAPYRDQAGKEFSLLANGQIVFRSGSYTSNKLSSLSEAPSRRTDLAKKQVSNEKTLNGAMRPSQQGSASSSFQPVSDREGSTGEPFVPVFPQDEGQGSKIGTSAGSWSTQTKPPLKRNLAKLSSCPGAIAIQQGVSPIRYEPDFPTSKPVATNKYQFVPTQFRTQPNNLPTPQAQRSNTSTNIYDKSSSFSSSKKIEVLSQLSANRKPTYMLMRQDCGDNRQARISQSATQRTTILKYSHRDNLSV